jgi:hypothetical protein
MIELIGGPFDGKPITLAAAAPLILYMPTKDMDGWLTYHAYVAVVDPHGTVGAPTRYLYHPEHNRDNR